MIKSRLCLVLVSVFFTSIFFAGCGEEKKEEVRSVEWYMAAENKEAYEAKIKECENNPGELAMTPNCINAKEAEHKKFYEWKGPGSIFGDKYKKEDKDNTAD